MRQLVKPLEEPLNDYEKFVAYKFLGRQYGKCPDEASCLIIEMLKNADTACFARICVIVPDLAEAVASFLNGNLIDRALANKGK